MVASNLQRRRFLGAAGVAGLATALLSTSPARAAISGAELVRADALRVGDMISGPDGMLVRVHEVTPVGSRLRIRYTAATSPDQAAGFAEDERGFSPRRRFAVFARDVPLEAVLLVSESPQPSEGEAGRVDVRSLGVPSDGVEDATAAIQAALDMGVPLLFAAGTYRTTGPLLLDSGADLEVSAGASLVKDFPAASGTLASWIRNRDFGSKVNGVRISGLGRLGAASDESTGNLICLYGDDIELRDVTVARFSRGRAITLSGDRIRVYGVRVSGSVAESGTGGIRYVGGRNFRCIGAHVESGDDCLQLVPAGAPSDPLFDQSIDDAFYVGCTGYSSTARVLVASLQSGSTATPGEVTMSGSIRNSGWTACGGAGTAAALVIQNLSSSGSIENLSITDCVIDMSVSTSGAGEINVRASEAGPVAGIHWTRGRIVAPQTSTVKLVGPVDNVSFTDFDAERGAQAEALPVMDLTGTNTSIVGGVYDGRGTDADVIAVAPNDARAVPVTPVISPREVRGIPNSRSGLRLHQVVAPRVVNGKYRPAVGAGTARAVTITSSTSNALVTGNDVTGFEAAAIVDLSSSSVLANNIGHG